MPGSIEWLVDGLVPKDRVTIIDGDPGQGESFLSFELVAAVSRGESLTPRPAKKIVTITMSFRS